MIDTEIHENNMILVEKHNNLNTNNVTITTSSFNLLRQQQQQQQQLHSKTEISKQTVQMKQISEKEREKERQQGMKFIHDFDAAQVRHLWKFPPIQTSIVKSYQGGEKQEEGEGEREKEKEKEKEKEGEKQKGKIRFEESARLTAYLEAKSAKKLAATNDFNEKSDVIAKEAELETEQHFIAFKANIANDDEMLNKKLKILDSDELIVELHNDELERLHSSINHHNDIRVGLIAELFENLKLVEFHRRVKFEALLLQFRDTLTSRKVNILMEEAVREVQMHAISFNEQMIVNQNEMTEIEKSLQISEYLRVNGISQHFEERKKLWRNLRHSRARTSFKDVVKMATITGSQGWKSIISNENLLAKETIFRSQIEEKFHCLIQSSGNMNVMNSSFNEGNLEAWKESYESLLQLIDSSFTDMIESILVYEKEMIFQTDSMLQTTCNELLSYGVVTDLELQEIIENEFRPFIHHQWNWNKAWVQKASKAITTPIPNCKTRFEDMFKYLNELIKPWSFHQKRISDNELEVKNEVVSCRLEYEKKQENLETEIQQCVSCIQTAATEQRLNDFLSQLKQLLENLENCYRDSHSDILAIMAKLTENTKRAFDEFEEELLTFFKLTKTPPTTVIKTPIINTVTSRHNHGNNSHGNNNDNNAYNNGKSNHSNSSKQQTRPQSPSQAQASSSTSTQQRKKLVSKQMSKRQLTNNNRDSESSKSSTQLNVATSNGNLASRSATTANQSHHNLNLEEKEKYLFTNTAVEWVENVTGIITALGKVYFVPQVIVSTPPNSIPTPATVTNNQQIDDENDPTMATNVIGANTLTISKPKSISSSSRERTSSPKSTAVLGNSNHNASNNNSKSSTIASHRKEKQPENTSSQVVAETIDINLNLTHDVNVNVENHDHDNLKEPLPSITATVTTTSLDDEEAMLATMLTNEDSMNEEEKRFLRVFEDVERPYIGSEDIDKIKLKLCLLTLERFMSYKGRTMARMDVQWNEYNDHSIKVLNDLLRRHQPRLGRLESEVYSERMVQLVNTRQRFQRHLNEIEKRNERNEAAFQRLERESEKLMDDFKNKISLESDGLGHIITTNALHISERRVENFLVAFEDTLNKSAEKIILTIQQDFSNLQIANAKFLTSFSEQKNVHEEEIKLNKENTEELEKKAYENVEKRENALKIIQENHSKTAKELVKEFRELAKIHNTDLESIEAITSLERIAHAKIRNEIIQSESAASEISDLVSEISKFCNFNHDHDVNNNNNNDGIDVMTMECENDNSSHKTLMSIDEVRKKFHSRARYLECANNLPLVLPLLNLEPVKNDSTFQSICDYIAAVPITPDLSKMTTTSLASSAFSSLANSSSSISAISPASISSLPPTKGHSSTHQQQQLRDKSNNRQVPTTATTTTIVTNESHNNVMIQSTFLKNITNILTDAKNGFTKLFNQQKALREDRISTRLDELPDDKDIFEKKMEAFLNNEKKLAEDHLAPALKDFYLQITKFGYAFMQLPTTITSMLVKRHRQRVHEEMKKLTKQYEEKRIGSETLKRQNENQLRPVHRFPNMYPDLMRICEEEKQRSAAAMLMYEEYEEKVKRLESNEGNVFLQKLLYYVTALIRLLDTMLMPDDVMKAAEFRETEVKRKSLKQLIRAKELRDSVVQQQQSIQSGSNNNHNNNNNNNNDSGRKNMIGEQRAWIGIPLYEFNIPPTPTSIQVSALRPTTSQSSASFSSSSGNLNSLTAPQQLSNNNNGSPRRKSNSNTNNNNTGGRNKSPSPTGNSPRRKQQMTTPTTIENSNKKNTSMTSMAVLPPPTPSLAIATASYNNNDFIQILPGYCPNIMKSKDTQIHRSVIASRDEAIANYKTEYFKSLANINKTISDFTKLEHNYSARWQQIIDSLLNSHK